MRRVQVVGRGRYGVYSSLTGALGAAEVRLWGVVPRSWEVHADDLLVVDLTEPMPCVEPGPLHALAKKGATLFFVLGESLIAPAWLEEIASLPDVRLFRCRTTRAQVGFRAVVTEALERVRGPGAERISTLVLQNEPALRPLERLVHAVCSQPWRIRRPHDLVRTCGMSSSEIKGGCAQAGFRVEHFMICVRLLVYERLVAAEHLPVRTARLLAGFGDPSNIRRHAHRAAQRSPAVARAWSLLALAISQRPSSRERQEIL
jgi:hypothetical protein